MNTEITGLLNCIEEPAIALATDYKILAANKAYCDTYGAEEPIVGRFCYEVSHHYSAPCDQSGESCPMSSCLESHCRQRVLHLHQTPRGEEHVDVQTYPVFNDTGEIKFLVETMREVKTASGQASSQDMVGRSTEFNKMLELIQRVAPSDTAALLQGESGTGKELVARAIHDNSPRANKPFVVVECSGLTESLFESELFGHEKGAFTGAHTSKIGLVEAAEGGTLFLDEIGDIPLSLQVKLLRLLETGTFRRVGSIDAKQANFRLISATHRNLEAMVKEDRFRRDLFYRISVFPVPLPALRERRDDLPLLAQSLLSRIAPDKQLSLDESAIEYLYQYAFPGNIRELRNILERASLLTDGNIISLDQLPSQDMNEQITSSMDTDNNMEITTLEEVENRYLSHAIKTFKGDRDELAEKLGISRRTLFRKIEKINRDNNQE